jgi:hypothetical protein
MQDDIDNTFVAVHRAVASVLASSTSTTISRYSNHSEDVLNVYTPIYTEYQELQASPCRTNVEQMLDGAVEAGGYRGGNCVRYYQTAVQNEIDASTGAIEGFDAEYGQVSLNVYRSYVGRNAMVESERIQEVINVTYAEVSANWNNQRPSVEELSATLAQNINIANDRLTTCFSNAYNYVSALANLIQLQIDECSEFNNGRAARILNSASFKNYMPEFQQLLSNAENFVW